MSLINEALKRTRDASYQNAARGNPLDSGQYRADSSRASGDAAPRRWLLISAIVAVVLLVSGLLFFALRTTASWPRPHDDDSRAVASGPRLAAPSPSVRVPAPTPSASSPVVAPPPADTKTIEDQVTAKVLAKIKAEQAAPAPPPAPVVTTPPPLPEPPKLVLQGITSVGQMREAMINGHTVREGDEVEGARLVAIEGRSVRLQFGSREFHLRMQ